MKTLNRAKSTSLGIVLLAVLMLSSCGPKEPFPLSEAGPYDFGTRGGFSQLYGINTLLLSASNGPVPDIVALVATGPPNNGIVDVPVQGGTAFAMATVNVGEAGGQITAPADTGGAALPLAISLCRTDPVTGQCLTPVGASVTTPINPNETHTFGIFVSGLGTPIAFDPAVNRIFVRLRDAGGVVRGSTSVAARTI